MVLGNCARLSLTANKAKKGNNIQSGIKERRKESVGIEPRKAYFTVEKRKLIEQLLK